MSDNPYNTPGPVMPGPPGGNTAYAAERVKVPAIGLMVSMGIGLVLTLLNLLQNALAVAGIGPMAAPQNMDPAAMEDMRGFMALTGGMGIVIGIISIIGGIAIIMGAIKMKNLESYSFALTASILALVPCISPCCPLGLIFGIWGIVVLNDPQVKAAFRS